MFSLTTEREERSTGKNISVLSTLEGKRQFDKHIYKSSTNNGTHLALLMSVIYVGSLQNVLTLQIL